MAKGPNARDERRHEKGSKKDQRNAFERDRDRIIYCSAFRRLAGVTQVACSAEGHVFHNRLTHSLKVAQIGRRISEKLIRESRKIAKQLCIDPEVVEAAALAHDLGHPPFGHSGEDQLRDCVNDAIPGGGGGFEGNPQSFRVVTRLSRRSENSPGLNLTRATLNALLKYPWHRETEGKRSKKFGAYHSEAPDFEFARRGSDSFQVSPEAQLMDWADDIAYAVHDVEDFYRASLIPLDRMYGSEDGEEERERFLLATKNLWTKETTSISDAKVVLRDITGYMGSSLSVPYDGNLKQRASLRYFTSWLIGRYIQGITIEDPSNYTKPQLKIDIKLMAEIEILKQLAYYYVFNNPALSAQQFGQRRIVKTLFSAFHEATTCSAKKKLLPKCYLELLDQQLEETEKADHNRVCVRIAADIVACMTEAEALAMYNRLTGVSSGSIRDLIIH